jgi:hypothetical protein
VRGEPPVSEKLRESLRPVQFWARQHAIWVSVAAMVVVGVLAFFIARAFSGHGGDGEEEAAVDVPAAAGGAQAAEQEEEVAPSGVAGGSEQIARHAAEARRRAAVDAGKPLSPNVKVVFKTYPGRPATVTWGGKRLGSIDRNRPLVIERPRDSGPLDVIVRATGYLPVHTRAYTFDDAVIEVKLTPLDKKDTVYGYRQPLPPDAGAPTLTDRVD